MGTLKLEKGKHFIHAEEKQKAIYVILQGGVDMVTKYDAIHLEAGNIIGLMASSKRKFQCDYVATEDTLLMVYDYLGEEDLQKIFKTQPKYANVFTMGAIKQANMVLQAYHKVYVTADMLYKLTIELHRDYKYLCSKHSIPEKNFGRMTHFVQLDKANSLPKWYVEYYKSLSKKDRRSMEAFYGDEYTLNICEIFRASEVMEQAVEKMEGIWEYLEYWKDILMDDGRNDLFQLYFDLEARIARISTDVSEIHQYMDKLFKYIEDSGIYEEELMDSRFKEYMDFDFTTLSEEEAASQILFEEETEEEEEFLEEEALQTDYSLDAILHYAGYETEEEENIKRLIDSYQGLVDIYSTEDNVRKLRKEISREFYELYKRVMKKALVDYAQPDVIKMFLNFGYMDTTLLGEENTQALGELTDYLFACNSEHVYTMSEWLKSIFEGRNEPSRNEFDLDYNGYLADLRKGGKITQKEQEEWKNDSWKKVEFEIDNMFASSNRAVYGRISIFVPMLCEHDIVQNVKQMLVTADRIQMSLERLKRIDFSVFYRDVVFSDPQHDITREFLKKEVLPDIILMPNAGSKAMMWQETDGTRRDTSGRFLFPILTVADLDELMVESAGRFRWEICRKEQGMRWNDIREPSLTSEYYDYVQFYRKNSELSSEAKEKMKNALWKAKNNYREVFVKDYQNWIKYESKGSFRLNKVSREILFKYCPFVKGIREGLKTNPMYQEMINRYEILNGRKKRHVELFEDKYTKAGGSMDEDLMENKMFYEL